MNFFSLIALLIYRWKDTQTGYYPKEGFENFHSLEENMFFLQKLIWVFFKGEKYDKKGFFTFLGFLQDEFYEKEYLLLDKQEYKSTSEKEFIKEMFYQVILKKFTAVIAKFPNSKKLKLLNNEFLFRFPNLKNILRHNQSILDQHPLNFEETLIYMRLEHKSEFESNKFDKTAEKEAKSSKAISSIENEIRMDLKMKTFVEKALLLQNYMVECLTEDVVDIKRLYDNIMKAEIATENCHKLWRKNNMIDKNNLDSKLIYGVFLRDILNMKGEGDLIIKEFHQKKIKEFEKLQQLSNIHLEDIDKTMHSNSGALCLLKKAPKTRLKIVNCNVQFSRILDKTKESLRGESIDKIIGGFSRSFYRKLMKREDLFRERKFLMSFKISKKIYKILPVEIKILKKRNETLALLKIHSRPIFRAQGDILVDKKGRIYGFSHGVMSVLNLKNLDDDLERFHTLNDISEDFENFNFFSSEKFEVKLGRKKILVVEPKKLSDSKLISLRIYRRRKKISVIGSSLQKSITFKKMEINHEEDIYKAFHKFDNSHIGNNVFKFLLNDKLEVIGKFHKIEEISNDDEFDIEDLRQTERASLFKIKESHFKRKSIKKINYAEGITMKRLVDGFIRDFVDMESEENWDDEEMEERSINKKFKGRVRKKSAIVGKDKHSFQESILAVDATGAKIEKFKKYFEKYFFKFTLTQKFLIYFSIFLSLSFTIHQFFLNTSLSSYFSRIKLLNDISNTAGIRNAAMMGITSKLQDLIWANEDGLDFTKTFDKNWSMEEYKRDCMNYIKFYFKDHKEYQNRLIEFYRNFHDQKAVEFLRKGEYVVLISGNDESQYNYWDSQNILYAAVAKMLKYKPEEITLKNKDVEFVYRNMLQSLLSRFTKANNVRFIEVAALMKERLTVYSNNLIILCVQSFIFIVFLLIGIRCAYQEIEKQVKFFIGFNSEIFSKTIKMNLSFIQKIQTSFVNEGNEEFFGDLKKEEGISNKNEFDFNSLNPRNGYYGRKRKNKGTIVPLCGYLSIIALGFISLNFYISEKTYRRDIELIRQGGEYAISFRTILVSDSVLFVTHILLQMVLYGENFAFHKNPAKLSLRGFIPLSQQLIGEFYFNNTMNYKLDEELRRSYDKYFMSNICDFYDDIQLPLEQHKIDCESFMNGWNKQNFLLSLARFTDETLEVYSKINYIYANKNLTQYPFDNECDPKFKSLINGTNKFNWCLLTSKQAFEIKLFHQYIHYPITLKMNEAGKKAVGLKIKDGFDNLEDDILGKIFQFICWIFFIWMVMKKFENEVRRIFSEIIRFMELEGCFFIRRARICY